MFAGSRRLLPVSIKFITLVYSMFLRRYPRSWKATRASDRSCCTRGWTTPSCGRRRHWRETSGAWSRRYAAHCPRWRSLCQNLFPHIIDEDTKGSVEWLLSWCKDQKLLFVNNMNIFWDRPRLFRADGLNPSRVGAELLSDNISRMLRSIWLVSQFSNNCYDDFFSTHLNDISTCSVQSIQTVSVNINFMQDLEKIWSWLNQKNTK